MKHKICTKCQVDKPLEKFVKDVYAKTGHKSICKACNCAINKEWRAKNPEKVRASLYQWRDNNKQYWLDYLKDRRGTLEREFEMRGVYQGRTPEEARAFMKEFKDQYDIDNKEKNSVYRKRALVKRGDEINARNRKKKAERRLTDRNFKLMERLRSRLKGVLKKQSAKKMAEYKDLFGCTIQFFREWIEAHFEPGMTWDNAGIGAGKWNLDHHYPCAAFDLTDVGQQKICFHYANSYPMWSLDNLSKNARIPDAPRENVLIPSFAIKVESKSNDPTLINPPVLVYS